jgi:hypothetical protein
MGQQVEYTSKPQALECIQLYSLASRSILLARGPDLILVVLLVRKMAGEHSAHTCCACIYHPSLPHLAVWEGALCSAHRCLQSACTNSCLTRCGARNRLVMET